MRRNWVIGVLAAGLLAVSGCYISHYPLQTADKAVVNRDYVGQWKFSAEGSEPATLVAEDFDGHQYYVEWDQQGKAPQRMAGVVTQVKGKDFAQLRNLAEKDGPTWLIVQVALKDGKLEMRQLNDEFFKKQSIHSSEDLRKVIEENVDNPQMYEEKTAVGVNVHG